MPAVWGPSNLWQCSSAVSEVLNAPTAHTHCVRALFALCTAGHSSQRCPVALKLESLHGSHSDAPRSAFGCCPRGHAEHTRASGSLLCDPAGHSWQDLSPYTSVENDLPSGHVVQAVPKLIKPGAHTIRRTRLSVVVSLVTVPCLRRLCGSRSWVCKELNAVVACGDLRTNEMPTEMPN